MRHFDDLTVIFDLDGTLVDSAPDITAAMNHALGQKGYPPIDPATVRHLVGRGARTMINHAIHHHRAEGQDVDALIARFLDYYAAHIADHTRPFDGVGPCLQALSQAGSRLAICTNKREALALPLLQALGLEVWFEAIIAGDSLAEAKPSALPLQEIIRRTGTAKAVMIGDSMTDYAASQAAQIPCLLYKHGYWHQGDEWPEDAIIFEDFTKLPRLIGSIST